MAIAVLFFNRKWRSTRRKCPKRPAAYHDTNAKLLRRSLRGGRRGRVRYAEGALQRSGRGREVEEEDFE